MRGEAVEDEEEDEAPRRKMARLERPQQPAAAGWFGGFVRKLWGGAAPAPIIPVLATLPDVDLAYGLDAA